VLGRPGSNESLARVRAIEIPLPVAMTVFLERTLPEFVADTRAAYPQFGALSPARRTALVSLVYNRGPLLIDRDPLRQERREMRVIRDLLAAGDVAAVPAQFESMARLWTLPGLIQRRHDEARLWRSGFEPLQLA
jgi:GH24 family phage-related lysozyme (muramidase)